MLTAAKLILDGGIVPLAVVFRSAFPGINITYSASTAKQRLLQMPLVVLRIGKPTDGNSQLYIMPYVYGTDYVNLAKFVE